MLTADGAIKLMKAIRPPFYEKDPDRWELLIKSIESGEMVNGRVWTLDDLDVAIKEEQALIEREERPAKELAARKAEQELLAMLDADEAAACSRRGKPKKKVAGKASAAPMPPLSEVVDDVDECAVCLEVMGIETNDGVYDYGLKCGHWFHDKCVLAWNSRCALREIMPSCPICRAPIPTDA